MAGLVRFAPRFTSLPFAAMVAHLRVPSTPILPIEAGNHRVSEVKAMDPPLHAQSSPAVEIISVLQSVPLPLIVVVLIYVRL